MNFKMESRVTRQTINAVPDPDWVESDTNGHEHRWTGTAIVKSIVWVKDHYECATCGEEIIPKYKPPRGEKQVTGRIHYYVDEVEVTRPEYERMLREQGVA